MNAPQNKSAAHSIIGELWAGRPEADAGHVIVDFLAAHTDAVHISFAQFFEIARQAEIKDQNVVLNIITYLTGTDLQLLKTGFEYIEEEIVKPLDIEQVRAARYNKINPITGDEDDEIGSKIFMYFIPSDLAKTALVAE
ncbi:hypothetical protein [Duganella sp. BJB476]|uniref:hypothetical protein n=1 Tax=Duganella sp. BJB476 TaxID=1871176 RepID=UPI000E3473C3|nr:hypothetical protein [Duganella sp. BJB476]RFP23897.1 hypothetical protein D0T21_28485 [Duganella sp. BJB476]